MVLELCVLEGQRAAESFRRLAEELGDVFWSADARSSRLLYISPGCSEIWGYGPAELMARPGLLEAAVHPEDRSLRLLAGSAELWPAARRSATVRLSSEAGEQRRVRLLVCCQHDERGVATRVTGVARDVSAEYRAREQNRSSSAELCALATELVLAEERERRELANELHDGLAQTLYMARLELDQIDRKGPTEELERRLAAASQLLSQGLGAVRSMTYQLIPAVLHDFGLIPALEALARDVTLRFGFQVVLLDGLAGKPVEEHTSAMLFRSVRELLTNVAKHAGASRAEVLLKWTEQGVRAVVSDDGCGFEAGLDEPQAWPPGFGLNSIRQRLEHLGGTLEVESSLGYGTKVTLQMPRAIEGEPGRGS